MDFSAGFETIELPLIRLLYCRARTAYQASIRWRVPWVVPDIIRSFPHDTDAFTQGLVHQDGWLYESTGSDHASSIRRIDPHTGAIDQVVPVRDDFCEGIAFLGGRLFQVSYKSGRARIYSLPDLVHQSTEYYSGDAWGLASDGQRLIMSDGTSVLRFFDQALNVIGKLRITSNGIPVRQLNDIEFSSGRLFANLYGSTDVVEIDPASGRVTQFVDCVRLASAAPANRSSAVMNGIAADRSTGTHFVTGKYWKTIFEIRIPPVR